MSARQLIAAFLSILLLAGGPSVGAFAGQNNHGGAVAVDATGCGDLAHTGTDSDRAAADCNEPKQSHCRAGVTHCSFAPVYGLVSGPLLPPADLSGQATVPQARKAYQNPVPEVLTPPPDLLS
ncbi:hypothetical protein [Marinobacter sp.]|uniref:hypothetical protein n=1 Tax=Marinobacter sp. TaxID=50741 RepID=UPI003566F29E